jgi:hypothetical protein
LLHLLHSNQAVAAACYLIGHFHFNAARNTQLFFALTQNLNRVLKRASFHFKVLLTGGVRQQSHSRGKVHTYIHTYEGVSKSFRTSCLEWELQMVQLSATRCNCIAILWVSLVSFAAITLCVASQRVFIFISLSTQSGNFWIHSRTYVRTHTHTHTKS